MVGQHTEKYVRLNAPFLVVKDGPLPQWRFKGPKGGFSLRQQRVNPPSLVGAQILTVGLQQVTPVQLFRARPLGFIQAVLEHFGLAIVFHPVITRHPRISLLPPPDRLQYLASLVSSALAFLHP